MSNSNLKLTRVHHGFQPKGAFHLYAQPSLCRGFSFETGMELSHMDGFSADSSQTHSGVPKWVLDCVRNRDL